jgi:GNAT superfamily N-acetyltransferase
MIEYRMMDEQTLLCRCMHGGPVPLDGASSALPEVSQDAVEAFLKAIIDKYGSCAVLVVDGESIVGVLWFYPDIVREQLGAEHAACIQEEHRAEAIARLNLESLPSKEDLPDISLRIECMMVVREYDQSKVKTDYTGRGIGKRMVKTLVAWAKDHGWKRIIANAIPDIKPLLLWHGSYSVERYKALGFRVTEETSDAGMGLLDAANSQKLGYHGPRIEKMWAETYSHVSDDEISRVYTVVLDL